MSDVKPAPWVLLRLARPEIMCRHGVWGGCEGRLEGTVVGDG